MSNKNFIEIIICNINFLKWRPTSLTKNGFIIGNLGGTI